jgi:hypothetical protein
MRIKTLKELESKFEILNSEENVSTFGGLGIYGPTDIYRGYIGDFDFTTCGYVMSFNDNDDYVFAYQTGGNGGGPVDYDGEYELSGYEGYISGYANANRFQIQFVTENFTAYYFDSFTGGYFLDNNNECFNYVGSQTSDNPNYDAIDTYYDQLTGAYFTYYRDFSQGV